MCRHYVIMPIILLFFYAWWIWNCESVRPSPDIVNLQWCVCPPLSAPRWSQQCWNRICLHTCTVALILQQYICPSMCGSKTGLPGIFIHLMLQRWWNTIPFCLQRDVMNIHVSVLCQDYAAACVCLYLAILKLPHILENKAVHSPVVFELQMTSNEISYRGSRNAESPRCYRTPFFSIHSVQTIFSALCLPSVWILMLAKFHKHSTMRDSVTKGSQAIILYYALREWCAWFQVRIKCVCQEIRKFPVMVRKLRKERVNMPPNWRCLIHTHLHISSKR